MDDDLRAALNGLAQGQDRLTQRLGQFAGGQERLASGQERLASRQGQLASGQEQLANGYEKLAKGQVELRTVMMTRFERIEDSLTSLREDVGTNMAAAMHINRVRADERKHVDDLFQLILKMQQQILRLETDVTELKKAS